MRVTEWPRSAAIIYICKDSFDCVFHQGISDRCLLHGRRLFSFLGTIKFALEGLLSYFKYSQPSKDLCYSKRHQSMDCYWQLPPTSTIYKAVKPSFFAGLLLMTNEVFSSAFTVSSIKGSQTDADYMVEGCASFLGTIKFASEGLVSYLKYLQSSKGFCYDKPHQSMDCYWQLPPTSTICKAVKTSFFNSLHLTANEVSLSALTVSSIKGF